MGRGPRRREPPALRLCGGIHRVSRAGQSLRGTLRTEPALVAGRGLGSHVRGGRLATSISSSAPACSPAGPKRAIAPVDLSDRRGARGGEQTIGSEGRRLAGTGPEGPGVPVQRRDLLAGSRRGAGGVHRVAERRVAGAGRGIAPSPVETSSKHCWSQHDRTAVAVLCGLRGGRDRFTVVDWRALNALDVEKSWLTIDDYLDYLAYCRTKAKEHSGSLREFDRAL